MTHKNQLFLIYFLLDFLFHCIFLGNQRKENLFHLVLLSFPHKIQKPNKALRNEDSASNVAQSWIWVQRHVLHIQSLHIILCDTPMYVVLLDISSYQKLEKLFSWEGWAYYCFFKITNRGSVCPIWAHSLKTHILCTYASIWILRAQ